MTAPHDPNPTIDTAIAGKEYHWVWSKKRRIALHKGLADKCKRVHYNEDGTKA